MLRFDFDIDSIRPTVTASAGRRGAPRCPSAAPLHLARIQPAAVGAAIALMRHHALREQAGERLVQADLARRVHRAREEARIEQVQDRMLDAADILIDRQPVIHRRPRPAALRRAASRTGRNTRSCRRRCRTCRSRARPGRRRTGRRHASRSDGGRADCRAGRTPRPRAARPAAGPAGTGNDAAGGAMDHRDRAAPVALAADAPVAQPPVRHAFAEALRLQRGDGRRLGARRRPARPGTPNDRPCPARYRPSSPIANRCGVGAGRQHHGRHRQAVGAGELQIALVVRGAAEHGARAVLHQHEIGDPDRERRARDERMRDPEPGVVAPLLRRLDHRLAGARGGGIPR